MNEWWRLTVFISNTIEYIYWRDLQGVYNSFNDLFWKQSLCKMSYWKVSDWIVIIPIAQSDDWWEEHLAK